MSKSKLGNKEYVTLSPVYLNKVCRSPKYERRVHILYVDVYDIATCSPTIPNVRNYVVIFKLA